MRIVFSWSTLPELRGLSKEGRKEVLKVARATPPMNRRILWNAILVRWLPGASVGFVFGFLSHPSKGELPPSWLLPFLVIGACISLIMVLVIYPSLEYQILRDYLASGVWQKEAPNQSPEPTRSARGSS